MRAQCFPTLYSRKQTFRGSGDPRRLSAGEKFAQGPTARRPLNHSRVSLQSLTPESTKSPLSPFLLLADTKGKMRKYSMKNKLTSVARHCPFKEVWKTDLTGVGLRGGIFFPFSVCMKQWGAVRGRHDRWLAHSSKTGVLHL